MGWPESALIEIVADKVSGVPLVCGTLVPVDAVIENRELGVDGIADQFGISQEMVRSLLALWDSGNRAA